MPSPVTLHVAPCQCVLSPIVRGSSQACMGTLSVLISMPTVCPAAKRDALCRARGSRTAKGVLLGILVFQPPVKALQCAAILAGAAMLSAARHCTCCV